MRLTLLACFLTACIAPVFADGDSPWISNVEKAQRKAAAEQKVVFLTFTSANMAPCKHLKDVVLDSPEFQSLTASSIVPVEIYFPKKSENLKIHLENDVEVETQEAVRDLTKEQLAYNWEMTQRYPIDGYPTVYLLDESGYAFWTKSGGVTGKIQYLADLKRAISTKNAVLAYVYQAQEKTGLARAELLDKAFKSMPKNLQAANGKISEEIISLDTEDVLGYKKEKERIYKEIIEPKIQREQDKVVEALNKQLSSLIEIKRYDEALTKINEFLKQDNMTDVTRQKVLVMSSQIYMLKGNLDQTLKILDEVAKINPNSDPGKQATQTTEVIRANRTEIERQLKNM